MSVLATLTSTEDQQSLASTLDKIAAAGFDGVEGQAESFVNPSMLTNELRRSGLHMPQAHFEMSEVQSNPGSLKEICATLGIHTIIVSRPRDEERPTTIQGWRKLAYRLNKIEADVRRLGLRIAWRNQSGETTAWAYGPTPMEILLSHATGVDWQIDLGEILRSGHDPEQWLCAHRGRIVSAHISDFDQGTGKLEVLGWGNTDLSKMFRYINKMPRLSTRVAAADSALSLARWKIGYDRVASLRHGFMFEGVTHFALKVVDLQAQLDFYSGIMGFKEMFRLHNDNGSVFLVYMRINDRQYLELFPGALGLETPSPDARGWQHLCLDVADLDQTVESLRCRGATMCLWREDLSGIFEVQGAAITRGRDGNRQSWVRDPEGNRIELMELSLRGHQYAAIARLSVGDHEV